MPISPWPVGQRVPTWTEHPVDDDGNAENFTGVLLTDCSMIFYNLSNDVSFTGTGAITIIQANPALVSYAPAVADSAAPGLYLTRLWVNFIGGPSSYELGIWDVTSP